MKASLIIFLLTFFGVNDIFAQSKFSRGEKVIRYQCGACHIKSLSTANPEALKIFNLENRVWARPLTDKIREKIVFNINERRKITRHELSYLMPKGYSPLPAKPSRDDVAAVKKFLKGEKNKPGKLSDYISL